VLKKKGINVTRRLLKGKERKGGFEGGKDSGGNPLGWMVEPERVKKLTELLRRAGTQVPRLRRWRKSDRPIAK